MEKWDLGHPEYFGEDIILINTLIFSIIFIWLLLFMIIDIIRYFSIKKEILFMNKKLNQIGNKDVLADFIIERYKKKRIKSLSIDFILISLFEIFQSFNISKSDYWLKFGSEKLKILVRNFFTKHNKKMLFLITLILITIFLSNVYWKLFIYPYNSILVPLSITLFLLLFSYILFIERSKFQKWILDEVKKLEIRFHEIYSIKKENTIE